MSLLLRKSVSRPSILVRRLGSTTGGQYATSVCSAVIEATGARRQKQARVDEVLAQLQGLSVALSTSSEALTAPSARRRFRKLHTVEASAILVGRNRPPTLCTTVHTGFHTCSMTATCHWRTCAAAVPVLLQRTSTVPWN